MNEVMDLASMQFSTIVAHINNLTIIIKKVIWAKHDTNAITR